MTSLINPDYAKAVQAFKFNTSESSTFPVTSEEAFAIAAEVARKVSNAFDMKGLTSQMIGRELSCLELCYFNVQNSDKSSKKSTVTRILAATPLEKAILRQTIEVFRPNKASRPKDFNSKEIPEEILRCIPTATLLFGIQIIHELANKRATTSSTNEEKAPTSV